MNFSTACMYSSPGNKRILWEVTNRCNANCKHCCNSSSQENPSDNEISANRFTELFEEIKDYGVNQMYLTGGEPLIRSDFFDILFEARKRFKKTILSSNGFYIDRSEALEFKKIKPDYVMISLDSANASIHDTNRNLIGLHDKACRSISLLSSYSVPVRVNVTITKFNYLELEELASLSNNLGAEMILYSTFVPVGRGKLQNDLFLNDYQLIEIEKEINDLRNKIVNIDIKYKRDRVIGTPLEECPGIDSYFYITSEGHISPCPWICRLDNRFISSISTKLYSFKETLNSIELSNFRIFIKDRKENHNCNPCKIQNCGHGCPALAKIYDKNYSGFDPYCWEYRK